MKKKLKIIYSKNGSGNPTAKLSLPLTWLRSMGLSQSNRNVEVSFKNDCINIYPQSFTIYTAIIIYKDKRYELTDKILNNLIEAITELNIQSDELIGALVYCQSYTRAEVLDTYICNNDIYNIVSNMLEDKSNWITISQLLSSIENYRQKYIIS